MSIKGIKNLAVVTYLLGSFALFAQDDIRTRCEDNLGKSIEALLAAKTEQELLKYKPQVKAWDKQCPQAYENLADQSTAIEELGACGNLEELDTVLQNQGISFAVHLSYIKLKIDMLSAQKDKKVIYVRN